MNRYITDGITTHLQTAQGVLIGLDPVEGRDGLSFEIPTPGAKTENISVTTQGRLVAVEVNDPRMKLSHGFRLPATVDPAAVEARYENGLLTISAPALGKREKGEVQVVEVK